MSEASCAIGYFLVPCTLILAFILIRLRTTGSVVVKIRNLDKYTVQRFRNPRIRHSEQYLVARKPSILPRRDSAGKRLCLVQDLGDCIFIGTVSPWVMNKEHEGVTLEDLLKQDIRDFSLIQPFDKSDMYYEHGILFIVKHIYYEYDMVFIVNNKAYEFKSNIKLDNRTNREKFNKEVLSTLKLALR